MILRNLESSLASEIEPGKIVIVIGPRQAGKTAMLKHQLGNALWLSGIDPGDREILGSSNTTAIAAKIGNNRIVVIDEAQRIENIGTTLKLLADILPDVQFYAVCSSANGFTDDRNNEQNLQYRELTLFPLTFEELCNYHGMKMELQLLDHRIIYGYYPESVMTPGNEPQVLKQLVADYLFKDIQIWERINKPERLERLVQTLALQIGKTVSYHDLGKMAGLTNETVEKYIQLLENSFVIFQVNSLSGTLKTELSKSKKIYFYDNGIRNAVINQFSPLALRNDMDALWENFVFAERKKHLNNHDVFPNTYFWRTKDKAEIKYIEEVNGEMFAYEFPLKPGAKARFPKSFVKAYHPKEMLAIQRENLQDWITGIPAHLQSTQINYPSGIGSRSQDLSMEVD
jgi:uncharacterized protein